MNPEKVASVLEAFSDSTNKINEQLLFDTLDIVNYVRGIFKSMDIDLKVHPIHYQNNMFKCNGKIVHLKVVLKYKKEYEGKVVFSRIKEDDPVASHLPATEDLSSRTNPRFNEALEQMNHRLD